MPATHDMSYRDGGLGNGDGLMTAAAAPVQFMTFNQLNLNNACAVTAPIHSEVGCSPDFVQKSPLDPSRDPDSGPQSTTSGLQSWYAGFVPETTVHGPGGQSIHAHTHRHRHKHTYTQTRARMNNAEMIK